jgi:hypothetical protein
MKAIEGMSEQEPPSDGEATAPQQNTQMRGALNYLRWLSAEGIVPPCTAETALEWFCQTLTHRPVLESLLGRYDHFKNVDNALTFFPVEDAQIAEKILIPLHQAKVAFVMGHELSCIALCGMVGEMLAIVRFEMSSNTLTRQQQQRLLGGPFENIEHGRRIRLLELMEMLDKETADTLNDLRSIRNTYLHNLSKSHKDMWQDALKTYKLTVNIAKKVLGLGIKEALPTISPEFRDYLRRSSGNTSPQTSD